MLRAGLRGKRLRLSDDDRRRLAVKAQALGREALAQIASVATPATLLRWYRCLIVVKYDGSKNRSPGRPPTVLSPLGCVPRFVEKERAPSTPSSGYQIRRQPPRVREPRSERPLVRSQTQTLSC